MPEEREGGSDVECAVGSRGMTLSGSHSERSLFFFFFFWLHLAVCGILAPRPGIEAGPPAVEAWSPNHWTTREFP